MYIRTLRFYARKLLSKSPDYTLVFADNSGWDLSRIRAAMPEQFLPQVEFLSFSSSDFDISKGKGYNEVLLITAAIARSVFLQKHRAFLKVTGRYPVFNMRYFLDYGSREILEKGKNLYIDIKDHDVYARLGLNWCSRSADVRLFGATNVFFLENVDTQKHFLNDCEGKMLEGLMYNLIKPRMTTDRQVVYRFHREPHYGGLEGTLIPAFAFSGNQNSFKSRMKRLTGNVLRTLAPDFLF